MCDILIENSIRFYSIDQNTFTNKRFVFDVLRCLSEFEMKSILNGLDFFSSWNFTSTSKFGKFRLFLFNGVICIMPLFHQTKLLFTITRTFWKDFIPSRLIACSYFTFTNSLDHWQLMTREKKKQQQQRELDRI